MNRRGNRYRFFLVHPHEQEVAAPACAWPAKRVDPSRATTRSSKN